MAFKIRPGKDVNYPMPLALSIDSLTDSNGNTIDAQIIKLSRDRITTSANGTRVTLRFRIPENLAGVANGLCEANLRVMRTDINQPVEVRHYLNPNHVDDPTKIQFLLERPLFNVSAPRGRFDELKANDGSQLGKLKIHFDVWKPASRIIDLRISTTSEVPREVMAQPVIPFYDHSGKQYEGVELRLVDSKKMGQRIHPGDEGVWRYELAIPEDVNFNRVFATFKVVGRGVQAIDLRI